MVIDQAFLHLAIGLLILIIVNISLGSLNAIFEQVFDFVKFIKGLTKGVIVVACFVAVYYVGALNPEIIAVNINGQELTVLAAINAVVLVGYFLYAKQVFYKLSALIQSKTAVDTLTKS